MGLLLVERTVWSRAVRSWMLGLCVLNSAESKRGDRSGDSSQCRVGASLSQLRGLAK